jgi:ParB family chromosome partitioning protein
MAPLDRIDAMPGQPRTEFDRERLQELAESIRESGIIQPLIVRAVGERLVLIAGERRLRAARLAGLEQVPVVVREATDSDAFVLALVENLQRQDLNPLEEARAYERLLTETGLTHDLLADRLGRSRSAITNALRLLRLPEPVSFLIATGDLSAGHARAVLSVGADDQPVLAEHIVTRGLSVRDAEALAQRVREGLGWDDPAPAATGSPRRPVRAAEPAPPTDSPEARQKVQIAAAERALTTRFGTRVRIRRRPDGAGRLEIHFASDEALKAIVDLLYGS